MSQENKCKWWLKIKEKFCSLIENSQKPILTMQWDLVRVQVIVFINVDRQAFIARRKKTSNIYQGECLDFGQIILKPYCAL